MSHLCPCSVASSHESDEHRSAFGSGLVSRGPSRLCERLSQEVTSSWRPGGLWIWWLKVEVFSRLSSAGNWSLEPRWLPAAEKEPVGWPHTSYYWEPCGWPGHLHFRFWTGVPVAPLTACPRTHAGHVPAHPPPSPPSSEPPLPSLCLEFFSSLFHLGAFLVSSRPCWPSRPSSSRKPSWLPQIYPRQGSQSPSHALHVDLCSCL